MFIRLFVALFLLACTMAEAASLPVLTVEFSADRTMEIDQGTMHGRIVATPSVERSEVRIGDMSTVLILNKDKKTGYMLMPAQKMYQVMDFAQANKQAGAVVSEEVDVETVGQEVVSGQSATKYKFVMKDKSAGGFIWYTANGIAVKMDVVSKSGKDKTRMTVTLDNIRIAPQDPKSFEVPAGFAKLPSGGMLGAMTGTGAVRAPEPSGRTPYAGAGMASDIAEAATDAAVHTASAEAAGDVAEAIDNPIARSAGVAAARKVLGNFRGLLRKKQ
jgi:hypothetical protein